MTPVSTTADPEMPGEEAPERGVPAAETSDEESVETAATLSADTDAHELGGAVGKGVGSGASLPLMPLHVENWLARGLLMVAVLFAYTIAAPLLDPGYIVGGDDIIHMAYNHEVAAMLEAEQRLYGWSYLYGLGAPIFLFRPPLQYFAVGLIYTALGEMLTIAEIQKLFYITCFSLFPFSLYYLLSKFSFRPLACGIAALFAITPISMWGHTIDAYFVLGLAKQLIAIFLFPIALGRTHAAVAQRRTIFPASLLITLSFLSHPYMPYCMALVCALYCGILLLATELRVAWTSIQRMFVTWAVAGLMLAIYLVPFYSSPEIQELSFSSNWRHAFEIVCMTTGHTVDQLRTGGLFDTTDTKYGNYGPDEWGWQKNDFTKRWPVLTALCFLGLAVTVWWRRKFRNLLFLTAWIMAFLVFLGPDDLPILEYLPLQGQFQYIHEIFLLDVFTVAAAGVGGAALITGVLWLIRGYLSGTHSATRRCMAVAGMLSITAVSVLVWLAHAAAGSIAVCWVFGLIFVLALLLFCMRRRCGPRLGASLATVLSLLAVAALVYSPWRDRWLVGQRKVRTRTIDTEHGDFTERSKRVQLNREFDLVVRAIREDPDPGRVYGSAQGRVDPQELPYMTMLPALCGKTNIISGFFADEVGGGSKLINHRFRKDISEHPNLCELLNVRFLICDRANLPVMTMVDDFADRIVDKPRWVAWRTRGEFNYFKVVRNKPVLVLIDARDQWMRLCELWLEEYKLAPQPDHFMQMIRGGTDWLQDTELDFNRYSAVVMAGYDLNVPAQTLDKLNAFVSDGGRVLAQELPEGLNGQHLPFVEQLDFGSFMALPAINGQTQETLARRSHHAAVVTLEQPGFVIFKMAYYKGWQATAGNQTLPFVEVGPGMSAIYLPAGRHDVTFKYKGRNRLLLGKTITLVVFFGGLLAMCMALLARRRKWQLRWPPLFFDELQSRLCLRRWPSAVLLALVFAAVGCVARMYVREKVHHVPVPIRPARHATMPTDIHIDWNALPIEGITYDVEVSDSGPHFEHIVYNRYGTEYPHARQGYGLAPGQQYWWRLRSDLDGVKSAWTRPIPFQTTEQTRASSRRAEEPFYIELTATRRDGDILVNGHSNLPDAALLMVRILQDGNTVIRTSEVRVKRGRLHKTVEPAFGKRWPEGVPLSLQIDFVLHQQVYPVTEIIGQNCSELQTRGVAEGHVLLYGIRSQTTIVPEVPSPVPDGMAPVDESGGWGCVVGGEIAAVAPAEIKDDGLPYVVRVAGRTNLPDNTRVRLQVFRENSETLLHRRDATVRAGVFTASVPVQTAEGYRIVAMVSPDFQYQSIKGFLGFSGEQIQARGVDLGELLYGLRYPLDLEGTW
jgi:hypothetical protein